MTNYQYLQRLQRRRVLRTEKIDSMTVLSLQWLFKSLK